MNRIETFAEHHRLKVTRDECNDQVIQGRRGQLYFDGPELCLMVLDGQPAIRSKWKELGDNLWMGDISPHPKTGKRVQDVTITGIPVKNAKLAIRMCRVKAKRIMSGAQKAVLDRARSLLPSPPQKQRHVVELLDGPGEMVRRQGNLPECRKACLDALLRRNLQTHLSRLPAAPWNSRPATPPSPKSAPAHVVAFGC